MWRARGIVPVLLLATLWSAGCGGPESDSARADHVVLLHGLGRSDRSMILLAYQLEDQGYKVTSVKYPSREERIEELAKDELSAELERCCADGTGRIHFVTHSMGGILLRYYLEHHEVERLGRVVMLSPPNQGSELADWAAENPILSTIMGPALDELGTEAGDVPRSLGPVEYELGVITGDRSLNPFFSQIIPGEDDGKVAVDRARVSGMTDFLIVPYSHSYIMLRDEVIDQVIHFLEHGSFDHTESED